MNLTSNYLLTGAIKLLSKYSLSAPAEAISVEGNDQPSPFYTLVISASSQSATEVLKIFRSLSLEIFREKRVGGRLFITFKIDEPLTSPNIK
jgi:hypothetical protein